MRIKFYGKLKEIFGETMEISDIKNIKELVDFLVRKDKRVEKLKDYLIFSRNKGSSKNSKKINIPIPLRAGGDGKCQS